MNSAVGHDENVARACDRIDQAVATERHGPIVLPELFNTLYFPQYRNMAHTAPAEPDDGPTMTRIRAKTTEHRVHRVATIYEEERPGLLYDNAMLVGPDGAIHDKYRKVHPSAVHSLEKIYFRYGSRFRVARIGDWRVGFVVFYDMLFPESERATALLDADLIVAPYATTRTTMWQEILRTRAFEKGVYLAACNKVGTDGKWTFGSISLIVDPLVEEEGGLTPWARPRRPTFTNFSISYKLIYYLLLNNCEAILIFIINYRNLHGKP
jgi:N-carbamoylputrescine amidase